MKAPTKTNKKTQIEELIERMETTGTLPWVKTWKCKANNGTTMPVNHISNKGYRGGNRWSLVLQQLVNGYSSNRWLTFNQARELGLMVTKGSKGTMITHYTTYIKEMEDGDDKVEHRKSLRTFTVFNLDQTNYVAPVVETESEAINLTKQEQELAAVLRRYVRREDIYLGYGNPSYNMVDDLINMPHIEEFVPREEYHSTLAHECVHSTGIAKRLNRYDTSYTHEKYSVEELVAELATIILCSEYGIDATIPNSEAYLQSWLKAIKQSPKFLTTVFGDAEKAVDYIKGI
jgi:antirestriction protein ArdC